MSHISAATELNTSYNSNEWRRTDQVKAMSSYCITSMDMVCYRNQNAGLSNFSPALVGQ